MLFEVAIFLPRLQVCHIHNLRITKWMDKGAIQFHIMIIISKQFHIHGCTKRNIFNAIDKQKKQSRSQNTTS